MSAGPLAAFQADFAAALASESPEARPAALPAAAGERFRIYRNNVRHGLAEALEAAYPAVARLVGDAFFRAMAVAFAAAHPPRARTLALYGEGFADFVAAFPPAASVPYLADVARLERAVLESLHAADAAPLDPAAVADLGETAAETRFAAHPATRLVTSRYPIAAIWRANRGGEAPAEDLRMSGSDPAGALVTRPRLSVEVSALAPAEAAFAGALLAGRRLADAHAAATAVDAAFDLPGVVRRLLVAGAFGAVRGADAPPAIHSTDRGSP